RPPAPSRRCSPAPPAPAPRSAWGRSRDCSGRSDRSARMARRAPSARTDLRSGLSGRRPGARRRDLDRRPQRGRRRSSGRSRPPPEASGRCRPSPHSTSCLPSQQHPPFPPARPTKDIGARRRGGVGHRSIRDGDSRRGPAGHRRRRRAAVPERRGLTRSRTRVRLRVMRWSGQEIGREVAAEQRAPALLGLSGLVRSVRTPQFHGVTFHEVTAKSALNRVPAASSMPFGWTVNPYRGCSHACVYCFARSSHRYLELDAGADFDQQVIVKINVAEVLRAELAKRSWQRSLVALGTNTDPYQRAEGRYRLMPGIIEALADSGPPLSILTKGTLLRRDLPLLERAAHRVPVDLSMSIAVFDDELQKSIEPGTPTTAARLATVRAAADAGFRVTVFVMPIMPWLTDSDAQLDDALA